MLLATKTDLMTIVPKTKMTKSIYPAQYKPLTSRIFSNLFYLIIGILLICFIVYKSLGSWKITLFSAPFVFLFSSLVYYKIKLCIFFIDEIIFDKFGILIKISRFDKPFKEIFLTYKEANIVVGGYISQYEENIIIKKTKKASLFSRFMGGQ